MCAREGPAKTRDAVDPGFVSVGQGAGACSHCRNTIGWKGEMGVHARSANWDQSVPGLSSPQDPKRDPSGQEQENTQTHTPHQGCPVTSSAFLKMVMFASNTPTLALDMLTSEVNTLTLAANTITFQQNQGFGDQTES